MSEGLPAIVDRFRQLHVLVVGDAILDSYLDGGAARLCREAPVPIVTVEGRRDAPGGAANTAANARHLGAQVRFLSIVGEDAEGQLLRRRLESDGVDVSPMITLPTYATQAKTRVLADGQMVVRFDQGRPCTVDDLTRNRLIDQLSAGFRGSDAIIISDYGYGVVSPAVIEALAELQRRSPRVLVVDARSLTAFRDVGITAIKPNYQEALALLGPREAQPSAHRAERIAEHGDRVLELTGAQLAAVTMDTEGALLFERGRPAYRTYARPMSQARAAGAGDTFASALALALAAGSDTPAAAEVASAAAAIAVGKIGTSVCDREELLEYFTLGAKCIEDPERLMTRVDFHRRQGRRIVFTNGCFDILHRGHITYLNRAKALGDLLIVGINSDASVRRLKGASRPINSLDDRVQVLAALSCIDHIVPFDGDSPASLIEAVRPDVYVKGGDYTRDTLPEAALVDRLGGQVQLLPFVEDRSTSSIIERIRESERRRADLASRPA